MVRCYKKNKSSRVSRREAHLYSIYEPTMLRIVWPQVGSWGMAPAADRNNKRLLQVSQDCYLRNPSVLVARDKSPH